MNPVLKRQRIAKLQERLGGLTDMITKFTWDGGKHPRDARGKFSNATGVGTVGLAAGGYLATVATNPVTQAAGLSIMGASVIYGLIGNAVNVVTRQTAENHNQKLVTKTLSNALTENKSAEESINGVMQSLINDANMHPILAHNMLVRSLNTLIDKYGDKFDEWFGPRDGSGMQKAKATNPLRQRIQDLLAALKKNKPKA